MRKIRMSLILFAVGFTAGLSSLVDGFTLQDIYSVGFSALCLVVFRYCSKCNTVDQFLHWCEARKRLVLFWTFASAIVAVTSIQITKGNSVSVFASAEIIFSAMIFFGACLSVGEWIRSKLT
jgi:hypothetical protein